LIRADSRHGFEFDPEALVPLGPWVTARFEDDAGLRWQLDQDMHLKKLDGIPDW
jgi:hypothetical protein